MSSWGPGFVQKKGHMILPYYHFVGFGDYADEFFKLVRSIFYAYNANEFLFIFDKVNAVSGTFSLFESTLKKNNYSRFLSYYPSQGFNVCERRDLLEPILQRQPPHDTLSFFQVFTSIFDLQDKIKEQIHKLYGKKNLSPLDPYQVGVCLVDGQTEFASLLETITRFATRPIDPLSLFVSCSSREQYLNFRSQCPPQWTLVSMWELLPPIIVTEEQKLDVLYAYLGSLITLSNTPHLIGSFKSSTYRFLYCKESRFRDKTYSTRFDGSSFSFF
jgi:hypothetical protein